MSGPAIKICGISTPATFDAVVEARVDYVGFVFYPPSPRHLSPTRAAGLAARAAGKIAKVGLFVDAPDAAIAEAVSAAKLQALQLHGSETPQRAAELRARYALPVWKVIAVASAADIARADAYAGAADLILFDAKTPKGALPGGMGLVFDWALLSAYRGALAWGLAGGLTADNVAEAVRATRAPLIDASSGLESTPGVKDVDKIAAFCKAARQ